MEKNQIRAIYLYEYKLGHGAAEASRNINGAIAQGTINERSMRRWFQKFRDGDESLEDVEGRGRPSSVDNDKLNDLIKADPRTTTRQLAQELNVSHVAILNHLKQLGKVKKLDKWVPHLLSEKQKNRRFEVCSSLLLRNMYDPLIDRIVTCDEKWVLYDNRRRSAQWLDHDQVPQQFPKPNLHQKKVMVSVWWYSGGIIHYNFLSPGETITADKYCKEIDEMHKKLQLLHPALVNRKRPIVLHDNARPHAAQMTIRRLHDLGYEILPHPPYSPDLSPTDYYFFKHLAVFLDGKIFNNQGAAENAFHDFIESRAADFYTTGMTKLVSRWQACVNCNGCYFN